jgi:4-amino-4-deoxy-L-arabinose transferase-like glycosyltransferase
VPGRASARRVRASRRRAAISRITALVAARPLAVILAAQTVLALRLVWSNTAFPDEALYLWSGRLEWAHWLHGSSLPNFPTYFSGAPVIYPPVAAVAAAAGGLVGGRILSLCFMLCTTVLLHGVARRIFDRRAAGFAVALFTGLGATQFLAAFATYDAMALMLLALATWLGIRAAESRPAVQLALLTGAAGALALADAAKYAATLFDPVVIAVAGLAAWRAATFKRGVLAVAAVVGALSLLLIAGIRLGGHAYWRGITYTTLSRAHGISSARGIIADSLGWTALVLILAVIGCAVTIARTQRPVKLCACVLTGALLLAPANQARIHVFTSLYKHVGFGSMFAAVVAGYALASFATAVPAIKRSGAVRAGAGVAAAGLLVGASLAHTHFVSWPNTTGLVAQLRALLPAHKGRVLAADNGNVIEYYLPDELDGSVFSGPWFLRYQDPDTGRYLSGLAAYHDAIKHRYFSIIALSFGDSQATDRVISADIRALGGYQLIATLPYRVAGRDSAFRIWVREGAG